MYSFLEIEKQNTNISINGKINSKNNDNIIYKKKIVKNANIFKNITKINSKNLDSNLSKINKKDYINNQKLNNLSKIKTSNNNKYKAIAKTNSLIKKEDLRKIFIKPDGNCYYRIVSYFLLGSQDYYNEIKNEIINWIENNKKRFSEFFGDDDTNNITKEE